MKLFFLLAALFASGLSFAASGTFRGRLAEDPVSEGAHRWLYLQGRNGSVRRVEISHAQLTYDKEIRRHPANASEALRKGAELRITASQDPTGEWDASLIEIVEMPSPPE